MKGFVEKVACVFSSVAKHETLVGISLVEGQLPKIIKRSSGGTRSSYAKDHWWLLGQVGGSCGEESGISVDGRGGSSSTGCGY